MTVLGISAFRPDAAAALVRDGGVVAAAQEERFTRRKFDATLPVNAIRYCIDQTGGTIDAVAWAGAPRDEHDVERVRELVRSAAPHMVVDRWRAHAASAFLPSPFARAAILTIDGADCDALTTIARGTGRRIELLLQHHAPRSLGWLYSAFTRHLGFEVNAGEFMLMGLAPYGAPAYVDVIRDHIAEIHADGSVALNATSIGYDEVGPVLLPAARRKLPCPPRKPDGALSSRHADIARSVQYVAEAAIEQLARHAQRLANARCLCLGGAMALNCVANGRLLRAGIFKHVWVQPAAGSAGAALGAALDACQQLAGRARKADGIHDQMHGAFLGPEFSDREIDAFLRQKGCRARRLDKREWASVVAGLVAAGRVVALFDGRMEFGPRALGHRSIIGDARLPGMQAMLNASVKEREMFRPFAPACLAERSADFFELGTASPYMQFVAPVRNEHRMTPSPRITSIAGRARQKRSAIPAVTHVDFSSRVQTVDAVTHGRFYELLKAFEKLTGCPVMVNTSFNMRGEPIVCTPEDAYRCFVRAGIDNLVMGSFLLEKRKQSVRYRKGATL